ncbi:MAG: hypothetical protein FWG82_03505 [Oscillospiraceae bacterium]|nr:hypothetical protein [Oscillospiraceae bacterium]
MTFREDNNHTLEKQAAFNLNIIRKLALNILRIYDAGIPLSMKKKRFVTSLNSVKHLSRILEL